MRAQSAAEVREEGGAIPESESTWRVLVDALREAPASTHRMLAINVGAGLAALAVVALTAGGEGSGGLVRLAGLTVGFFGLFLVAAAYLLHHSSQNAPTRCSRLSFFQLRYGRLHRVLLALPLLSAVAAVCLTVGAVVYAVYAVEKPLLLVVVGMFVGDLILALRLVAGTGRFLYRHAREQAEAAERARTEAAEAQLAALQAQLNPHFLFNALNTVAGLVRTDPDGAEAAVENLAAILRRTLARSRRQWTTLREELDYVRAYLGVEQQRWGERLKVDWTVEAEALDLRLPPMTLQPLVENALRHGLGNRLEGGRVEVGASRRNGRLRLEVSDDGVGFPARYREGTGLENLRRRIDTLYGEASSLRIDSAGGGARVIVELPAEEAGA